MSSGIDLSYIRRDERDYLRPHVEEGATTYGKKDASGVPRLYVEVKNEDGAVVYSTWQNGPLGVWGRATLYFGRFARDADGKEIGFSLWD
jgi:hypothetical protein